jgi:NAD(P)H-quinone oxidoreductase subunit 5
VVDAGAIAAKIKPLYNFSLNKWYIDDIYDLVFVQGSRKLAKQVLEIDIRIVDGLVNLAGLVTLITGEGPEIPRKWSGSVLRADCFWGCPGLVLISGIT